MEFIALLMLPLLLLYFLPAWIAFTARHKGLPTVLVLNLLLGWTLIGWFGLLVYALLPGQRLTLGNAKT